MEDGKYVLKPWDLLEEEFGLNSLGNINLTHSFTKEFEKQLPDSRIIEVKDNKSVRAPYFEVSPDMLFGPFFRYKQDCEVSNNGKQWYPAKFVSYSPGREYYIGAYRERVYLIYCMIRLPKCVEIEYPENVLTLLKDYKPLYDEDNNVIGCIKRNSNHIHS